MIYLEKFRLPSLNAEEKALNRERRTVFNDFYPFRLFPNRDVSQVDFSDVTIFYGDNGSGKTTLLNLIAEKAGAERSQAVNKGELFARFVEMCQLEQAKNEAKAIRLITSEDVFEFLLDVRGINTQLFKRREALYEEYLNYKFPEQAADFSYDRDDYEQLKNAVDARRMTMSAYVRSRLAKNKIVEHSNGETALMFFEREIQADTVYLLDEPENSLSAASQLQLVQFLEESARFFGCQFVISTHSPFLLSLKGAKIINLDDGGNQAVKWTELENVRTYYDFFKQHADEFEEKD